MSAPAVSDFLVRESGRYMTPIMERRVFPRSIILSLIPRGEWMNAMGTSINVLQYERSAPTSLLSWQTISPTDGQEGGSCLPAVTNINVASTNRSFNLAQLAFHGPPLCNIDTMFPFDLYNQLSATAGILGDYVKLVWEQRYREEYFRLCQTKIVYDACAPSGFSATDRSDTSATTYPTTCPTKALDIGILRALSIEFMRDGAGAEALLRGAGGEPLMTVLTDSETAGDVRYKNLEIRQDIRWSNQNSILLKNFGVGMDDFGGFTFLVDSFPRRFICNAGTYTQVFPFDVTAASRGNKAIVRASYKTAPVAETFLFDKSLMTILIPRPPTAPAPDFQFNPVNYLGELKLLNILHATDNPDGNIVFHRMRLASGTMPNNIERGAAIAHLRCDPAGCSTGCASS